MVISKSETEISFDGRKISIEDSRAFRKSVFDARWKPDILLVKSHQIPQFIVPVAWDLSTKKCQVENERKKRISDSLYGRDFQSLPDRFFHGAAFELYVWLILHGSLDGFNMSGYPNRDNYSTPDFENLALDGVLYPKIGAKTVIQGFCPMVFQNSKYHEIIGIMRETGWRPKNNAPRDWDRLSVSVMGIASKEELSYYGHIFLVGIVSGRENKHGYYGPTSPSPQLQLAANEQDARKEMAHATAKEENPWE